MKDNIKINTQKGLFFSFLVHSVVFIFYFLYFKNTIEIKAKEEKMIVFELEHMDTLVSKSVSQPIQSRSIVQTQPIHKNIPQSLPQETESPKQEPIKQIEIPKVEPHIPTLQKIVTQKAVVVEETMISKSSPLSNTPTIKSEPSLVQPEPKTTQQTTIKEVTFSKTDFAIIRNKVLENLIYPNIARRLGWNGIVHIALVIDTNGKLINAKVHQSSGKTILDKSALDASLQLQSEQLPKPDAITTIILPVAFSLKGVE